MLKYVITCEVKNMKYKLMEFLEKSVSGEIILKRIAFYLFLICVLLGLVFFKLNEINESILMIAEPISVHTKEEKNKDIADVFIEEKGEIGDVLPFYNELEESTSEATTTTKIDETNSNIKEHEDKTNTTTEVATSNNHSSSKINFVINVNSNKIHYADCSFVNRMKEENRKSIQLSDSELKEYLNNGYTLCSTCGG